MDTTSSGGHGNIAGTVARLAAAVAVLIGGLVHLQLYFDGYRDFPNDNLGRSFLLNAVGSVVIAIALVLRRDVIVRLAGVAMSVGTLIAFALSRTDDGIFGLTETGLNPSPQGAIALIAEIVAIVLLAATFVPTIGPGDDLDLRAAAPTAAAIAVVAIVGGALWAQEPDEPTQAGPSETVSTVDTTGPTSSPPDATSAPTTAGGTDPATPSTEPGDRRPDGGGGDTRPPRPTDAPATDPPPTEVPEQADAMTITISDFSFDPEELEIPVGTTVEWINEDSFDHSVVAEDDSFRSETLGNGDTFSFTFEEAGEYPYICGIHPSMQATIVVT